MKLNDDKISNTKVKTSTENLVLPEQSTTGPLPPAGCDRGLDESSLNNPKIIENVPRYLWYNGCGPTAAGMVIGYWDGKGFDDLVEGKANFQTDSVNKMISSEENYNDYCIPLDTPDHILPDKSELPVGDEHDNNSLADFFGTSQSYHHCAYGWGGIGGIDDYVLFKNSTYSPIINNKHYGCYDLWSLFRKEIDNGRPVVLFVDIEGDNKTDHFVTGIGYDDNKNYACLDTWDTSIHWYDFSYQSSGNEWGIRSVTTCILGVIPYEPINTYPLDYSRIEANNITFRWECEDPDEDNLYHLYLMDHWGDSDETDLLVGNLTEKYYSVSNLESGILYYWWVVAEDKDGITTKGNISSFYFFRTESPTIEIYKPETGYLYINGNIKHISLLPQILKGKTVIIGEIFIWFNAEDNVCINKIELYINDQLKFNESITYENQKYYDNNWWWHEQLFGKCILKAVVYDSAGNIGTDEMTVWKFF